MAICLLSCGLFSHKPKGELTYCSYRSNGAAGLGTDYCQLIAEADSLPRVVVVLNENNRFGDPVTRRSYSVDKSVVDSLAKILMDAKVYKLNGYNVNAFWYGNKIKKEAWSAYRMIENFFAPWRKMAAEDEKNSNKE